MRRFCSERIVIELDGAGKLKNKVNFVLRSRVDNFFMWLIKFFN